MELGLASRVCVVTGASRGIGSAVARVLCAEGARVLLVARDPVALDAAAADCGGAALTLTVDVTAPGAAARIASDCEARLGPVAVLVNNAGTSANRGLHELTDADWRHQWELSVMAPLRLMRALVPGMAARGWGRVVNVASSAGKQPAASNAAYSAAKAAQLSLSRAYAQDYAGRGVLVNCVAPGRVDTPLRMGPGGLVDQAASKAGGDRWAALARMESEIPLQRMGSAEEIASVIVLLCSERSSYVTGSAWSVDGGLVRTIV